MNPAVLIIGGAALIGLAIRRMRFSEEKPDEKSDEKPDDETPVKDEPNQLGILDDIASGIQSIQDTMTDLVEDDETTDITPPKPKPKPRRKPKPEPEPEPEPDNDDNDSNDDNDIDDLDD